MIYRDIKGSKLTSAEVDANFRELANNITIVPDVVYFPFPAGSLTYKVRATLYPIAGAPYTAAEDTVTLDNGDGTHDRFDRIIADINGVISKKTGTPSANPIVPYIDEATQYSVAILLVKQNATAVDGHTSTVIYSENVEWTTTESTAAARINLASTNDPAVGSLSIEATSPQDRDTITFTAPSALNVADVTFIKFRFKNKAAFAVGSTLAVRLGDGVTTVLPIFLANGVHGFDNASTSTHQEIVIPIEYFETPFTSFTTFEILQRNSSLGWFVDEVEYVGLGGVVVVGEVYLSNTQQFTATASQTHFVLSSTPNNVDVYVDRIYQIEGVDYTLSGATVTMNEGLDSGSLITIRKF